MKRNEQLIEFAEYVLNHPAKEEVIDRMIKKMMVKFRHGDDADRLNTVAMMDSIDMFFSELSTISAEAQPVNEEV